jgi:hypothetical protein
MTPADGQAPAAAAPSGGDTTPSADPSPAVGDGRPGGGDDAKGPDPGDAKATSGEAGQPAEEQAPSQHLGARSVQYVTNVWKVEHQHVGVQQTGTVQGGMAMGLGASTTVTTQEGADRGGPVRGRIRPGELARVRAVHVAAPAFRHARAALRRHHVALLHGRAGWGKATTAVRLLDLLHPGEVYVVDSKTDLAGLDVGGLEQHRGYLAERLTPETAAALSAETLLGLSERLAEQDSHLVVTVDGLIPLGRWALGDALVSCDALPDAGHVLHHALAWQLDGDKIAIERLVRQDWVEEELAARPAPARVAALALLLAELERGRMPPEQTAAARRKLVTDQVTEWFETHPERRERCLMVALAVLNRGSYQEAADAAERLDALLEQPVGSRPSDLPASGRANPSASPEADEEEHEPPRRPHTGVRWHLYSSRERRVQDCYGRLTFGSELTLIGDVPAEIVQLDDDGLQRAVLDHVWLEHDVVRSTLVTWFRELGAHPSLDVSSRAAAAVGSLLKRDFRYLHDQLLREWAGAEERDVRWSAAVALDVLAAASPEDEQRVQRLLHHWITANPTSPQAWTAVAAYGFEVGQRCTDAALDDLLTVIRQHSGALWIAGCTMANLCEAGQAIPVLDRLITWITQRRVEVLRHRAPRVFLHAAETEIIGTRPTADGSGDPPAARSDPPAGTPVLLWVAAPETGLRERLAKLWSGALDYPPIEGWAGNVLRRWVDRAGEEPALQPLLDLLLDELGRSPRIGPIVGRLLSDWANDPFRPSRTAAQRLELGPSQMAALRR